MSENKHKTYQELIEEDEVDFKNHDVWMQRNNHYGEPEWELLGFKDGKFIHTNGEPCYISIGFQSNKLDENDYKKLCEMEQDSIRLSHYKFIYREKLYPDFGEKRPLYRPLYRFLFEYKVGDYLLIPGNGEYHVFRIASGILLRRDIETEIPKWIKMHDVSTDAPFRYLRRLEPVRVKLLNSHLADQSLSSRLKFRGTISWLDDALKESLKKALTSDRISLHADLQKPLCKPLLDEVNRDVNDYKFEKLIKWYFLKIGASSAKVLGKNESGTQDADVEATFEALRVKVYVQAKKQKDAPQIEDARKQIEEYKKTNHTEDDGYTYLYWVIHASADEPKFENETDEIRLINGIEFASMLLDAGIEGIDEAFYGKDSTEKKDTEK